LVIMTRSSCLIRDQYHALMTVLRLPSTSSNQKTVTYYC
jgi:hypothetical protein